MIRAWVRSSHHDTEWKSGWLIGPVSTSQGTKVVIAFDEQWSNVPNGLRLETVDLSSCRPMRTEIDFLPDAAKV